MADDSNPNPEDILRVPPIDLLKKMVQAGESLWQKGTNRLPTKGMFDRNQTYTNATYDIPPTVKRMPVPDAPKPEPKVKLSPDDTIEILRGMLPEEGMMVLFLRDYFPDGLTDLVVQDYVKEVCPRYFWKTADYHEAIQAFYREIGGTEGDVLRLNQIVLDGPFKISLSLEVPRVEGGSYRTECSFNWLPPRATTTTPMGTKTEGVGDVKCLDTFTDDLGAEHKREWKISPLTGKRIHSFVSDKFHIPVEEIIAAEDLLLGDLARFDRRMGQVFSYDLMGTKDPLSHFLASEIRR